MATGQQNTIHTMDHTHRGVLRRGAGSKVAVVLVRVPTIARYRNPKGFKVPFVLTLTHTHTHIYN